jgi:transposase
LCWAHLKRNILGVLEFTKKSATERFCRDALALHARLFRLWHKFKSGQIDRDQLCIRSIPVQKKFLALAEANLDNTDRQVQNLAIALFVNLDKLFTFLEMDGVEPTNNSAERALRTGVQWRKICFGNRSSAGELATARLLTVSQTCRIQQQNSLRYLSEAISRHRKALPVATLFNR